MVQGPNGSCRLGTQRMAVYGKEDKDQSTEQPSAEEAGMACFTRRKVQPTGVHRRRGGGAENLEVEVWRSCLWQRKRAGKTRLAEPGLTATAARQQQQLHSHALVALWRVGRTTGPFTQLQPCSPGEYMPVNKRAVDAA